MQPRGMAYLPLVTLLALLVGSSGSRDVQQEQGSNSVHKVVQMLSDMLAKAKSEKNAEEVAYAEFSTWCTDEKANLVKAIAAETESIETLSAKIDKLASEVKTLGEEIGALQADITKFEADTKAAVAQREKEHTAFLAEEQDYSESVDAIDRAIVVLQKQSYDRTGSSSALLQLQQSAQLPANAKAMIAAFVGMMSDDSETAPPEANAYEFQSGGVVEMLKKLKDEFRSKLSECQKEEMNSKHASDMVVSDLTDSAENAKKDVGEKTEEKEKKAEAGAIAKKELGQAISSKKEDESTLSSMKAECFEKKLSFDSKQQLRGEEIEAIQKAVEILSDPEAMSGVKHLSLAQTSQSGKAFAQFLSADSSNEESEGIRRKVREFLASRGKQLRSKNLELLAEKLAADPFAKVKKMIDDMITRLLEEAKSDADHEGFCDKEMGQSKITRAKLTEDIDSLDAAVEEGKAQILLLKQEITELTAEVADLDAAVIESTKLRKAEKSKNAATVEDAAAAISAVEAATSVLKEFYKAASTATALVQDSKKPQTFGDAYTGQQEEAGGVMALLEVILADFSNLKADTEAAESAAQNAYESFMTQAKKDKAVKLKAIEMDEADKIAAESKLSSDTNDLKSTQDQLLAAERYHANLVPQCVDQGQTFEERTGSRAAEIQSLKEALKILEGM